MNEYVSTGTSLTHTVADWLMSQALTGGQGVDRIVEGCCARLSAAGIPIWGANISFRTLHPLFRAMSVTWMRDAGVASTGFGHQGEERGNRRPSPINRLITTRVPVLRRRLTGPETLYDFPILDELRDKGATDYLAFVVPFNEDWSDGSWATDRPSGFSDGDIRELLRIQQRLAVACKVKIKDEIARNIVDAYLGHKAGSRVIAGRIKRGDAETIHAAIWYSDLRNSTGFAESLPPARYLSLLDDYFQCTAGAVMDEGGEVLLLLGDAVLSIFSIDEAEPAAASAACEAAMRAVAEAERRLAEVNHARTDGLTLDFGIGLHVGDLTFGNIGVPARLRACSSPSSARPPTPCRGSTIWARRSPNR